MFVQRQLELKIVLGPALFTTPPVSSHCHLYSYSELKQVGIAREKATQWKKKGRQDWVRISRPVALCWRRPGPTLSVCVLGKQLNRSKCRLGRQTRVGHRDLLLDRVYPQWKGKFLGASTMGCACMLDSWVCGVVWRGVVCQITSDTCLYDHDYDDHYQWRSKASVGPGSTVTWGPSVASAQGLKLEAQSAERGGGALGRACYPGLGSGVSSPSGVPSCQSFWCFLCSQMTSPVIENPACTAQVYHFTHFYHACKNDSSVVGLGHPHVERN